MTHAELVQRAAKWLRGKKYTVFTECGAKHSREVPDVIGFSKTGSSIVIECNSDFWRSLLFLLLLLLSLLLLVDALLLLLL